VAPPNSPTSIRDCSWKIGWLSIAVGEYWGSGGLSIFARLRDGVTPDAARAELRAWILRIRTMFPWRMPDAWGKGAAGLRDHLVAGARLRSLLLLGVVVLVLMVSIVNVANLMIGQTADRPNCGPAERTRAASVFECLTVPPGASTAD
jgi:hypothetical protein